MLQTHASQTSLTPRHKAHVQNSRPNLQVKSVFSPSPSATLLHIRMPCLQLPILNFSKFRRLLLLAIWFLLRMIAVFTTRIMKVFSWAVSSVSAAGKRGIRCSRRHISAIKIDSNLSNLRGLLHLLLACRLLLVTAVSITRIVKVIRVSKLAAGEDQRRGNLNLRINSHLSHHSRILLLDAIWTITRIRFGLGFGRVSLRKTMHRKHGVVRMSLLEAVVR